MLCFQRNWFRADLCEMARSCSKLQQVDRLCKYAENSTIKVFYWGWLRVPGRIVKKSAGAALFYLCHSALPAFFALPFIYSEWKNLYISTNTMGANPKPTATP